MNDIFLSYKSEDKLKAQIIAGALKQKGYSVWWDRVIPPGRTFDEVIEENLNSSKCVVVLWSGKSIKSKWVITEAGEGDSRGILIPVLIEEVKPPLAFRRIEAAKLIDWDGSLSDDEFELLLGSLERILGASTGVQASEIEQPDEDKPLSKKKEKSRTSPEKEDKTFTNSLGMKFALIPGGGFGMGSPPDEDGRWNSESPVHTVNITKPFYLGIYPVTQKEWQSVMGKNPSYFKGDRLPVEQVSWKDVQEFIKKLNEKEGVDTYRLPSEAEWEYAARAGTTTRYSFGDNDSNLGDYAWYNKNSGGKTHPEGEEKPNPWGLSDMHGNIWEWVQDKWHNNYNGAPLDGSAWESGESSFRVCRGGSWLDKAGDCRSASRHYHDADDRNNDHGFRLLRIL